MFDETRLDSLLKQANDPSIVPDFSAAEVRRAGGRRRRRRYLATTATAVVVGLLSIGGIVALTRAAVSPTVAAPATPTLSATAHETPSTPPLQSSASQTPTTRVAVVPTSTIDSLLPLAVGSAQATGRPYGGSVVWDPAVILDPGPNASACGTALNGSFTPAKRGTSFAMVPGDSSTDWGYALAYLDPGAATTAIDHLTQALTGVCAPVAKAGGTQIMGDGVTVSVFTPAAGGRIYLIRDRNVVVYWADTLGIDPAAFATALHAKLP